MLLISARVPQDGKYILPFNLAVVFFRRYDLHCTLDHCVLTRLISLKTYFFKLENEFRPVAGHSRWLWEIPEAFVCVDMFTADLSRIPHDGERLHGRHATPLLSGFKDGRGLVVYCLQSFKCEHEHLSSAGARGLVHGSFRKEP